MKLALALFMLISALGFGLLVAGIFLLAGSGWALIAGGISSLAVAAFLRKGLISG